MQKEEVDKKMSNVSPMKQYRVIILKMRTLLFEFMVMIPNRHM